MQEGKLELGMRLLGRAYILGLLLQVRIDGRSILIPLFAVWCCVLLSRLRPHHELSDTAGVRLASGSAAVVAAGGFLSWVPAVEPGAMGVLLVAGIAVGSAGYASAIEKLCLGRGWTEPAAAARSAVRWLVANTVAIAVAIGALLAFVSTGPADPDSSFTPSVMFGRPIDGVGATAGFLAIVVLWIVATIRLRKASQAIRQRLSAQTDLEPVGT